VLAEGRDRIMAFGTRSEPWDRRWTVAAFSVPEARRALRHVLRTRLLWLGFASLYDGMWVSPHDSVGPALEVLRDLKVERARADGLRAPSHHRRVARPTPGVQRPIGGFFTAAGTSSSPLSIMSPTIGVSIGPGADRIDGTPRGADSSAARRVTPITPCFDA
jgi:hypothetical protein